MSAIITSGEMKGEYLFVLSEHPTETCNFYVSAVRGLKLASSLSLSWLEKVIVPLSVILGNGFFCHDSKKSDGTTSSEMHSTFGYCFNRVYSF
mmetsp:Transcript_25506/g.47542  ORF Transcript_25506/g.47542 Transcript_25506/m.47542 type:complete len:93 (-) Transcript_25506:187-465(-)